MLKNNILKANKGITMVTLVIMIIVLLILASITVIEGNSLIKKAKVENLLTDMITIKAKTKGYAEEVNSKVWNLSGEEKINKIIEIYQGAEYKINAISSITDSQILSQIDTDIINPSYWAITTDALNNMGLKEVAKEANDETYVIVYNPDDCTKLDVIYLPGALYNKTTCYTLSYLQGIFEEHDNTK